MEQSYSERVPPTSIDLAERRIETIGEKIMLIDYQLGLDQGAIINAETDKRLPEDDDEYDRWRSKAVHAKIKLGRERNFLKRWLKNARILGKDTRQKDLSKTRDLIEAAYVVIRDIKRERGLSDDQLKVNDALKYYLQHN